MERRTWHLASGCIAMLLLAGPLGAAEVTVEVQNLSQADGFWLSPMWVGFHNGNFDLFDACGFIPPGEPLERLAEDGNANPLRTQFAREVPRGVDGVIGPTDGKGPMAIAPGQTVSMRFTVDGAQNQFMSFASMVMPSNDAFIGNDDPLEVIVFQPSGAFKGVQVIEIYGTDVWDAGTEANLEQDAAFFGQTAPNTGLGTICDIVPHEGLNTYKPIILGGTNRDGVFFDVTATDFVGYGRWGLVARITIIPEPATAVLLLGGLLLARRRRQA